MSARELDGKVALVTGGSRGIGRAIAEALAEGGARVAVVGRDGDKAKAAAAALPGGGHAGFACDVADPQQVNATLEAVEAGLGPVDILVNNAGITRDNLAMRMKDEEWDDVIDTNLKAVFRMSKLVMRGMMKARTGRIINITSVVGEAGNPGQANYAAAKAGVIALTKVMAKELARRGITVNAVAPGFVETEMTAAVDEAQKGFYASVIPAGRMGRPEDIASAVEFLASPDAAYVTGHVLHVNGGLYM